MKDSSKDNEIAKSQNWIWIEKIFKSIPITYTVVSFSIGIIVYFIYCLFHIFLNFDINQYNITILSTSFAISLEMAAINYFVINFKQVLYNFENGAQDETNDKEILQTFKDEFVNNRSLPIIFILVVIPFIVLLMHYNNLGIKIFFFQENFRIEYILYDCYNIFVSYFALYLLAVSLWILLTIILIIKTLGKISAQTKMEKTLFSIKELMFKYIIYLSILTILLILSYSTPAEYIYYETLVLISLYLVAIFLFLYGWDEIRKALQSPIDDKIGTLIELSQLLRDKIIDDLTRKDRAYDLEINQLIKEVDFLHNEIDRLKNNSIRVYSIRAIAGFIISALATFTAFLENFQNIQRLDFYQYLLQLFNQFLAILPFR